MPKLTTASEPTPRTRAGDPRRALLLAALLLCCAVRASAQEVKPDGAAAPPQPRINVKPFEDVALRGKQLVEQGKLRPDTTLHAVATAECDEGGRLRPETLKIDWHTPADEALRSLSQQAVAAFSESGVLAALGGVKAVRLALNLDRQNVSVQVAAEMPSEAEANRYAGGYGMVVKAGARIKGGTDEGELYKRLGFTSEGKMFKMSFEMPRAEAARMIADMLARKAAKAASGRD